MSRQTRREFLQATGRLTASAAALSALPVGSQEAGGATRKGRPNILLFFPDQHRFDWLGLNPHVPVRTPNIDALAKRGVWFPKALTPSPLCAPARACLAAGKEYDRCRVPSNGADYPLDQTTFYSLLRASGYHVMGCGKFDLHKASPTWGIDGKHLLDEWGFSDGIDNAGKWDAIRSGMKKPKDPYMYYLEMHRLRLVHIEDFRKRHNKAATFPTPLPEEAYCDNWIGHNGLELLKRAPGNKPWFLQVNFAGPHSPWDITKRMERLCRGLRGFPPPNQCKQFTAEQHIAIRQNYSVMIENIDRWLGIYIEQLRTRRQLDNTLIVFSSDHGEMLGDHNRWGKSLPYQPSAGVPLIIAGPGVRKGLVSDIPVTTMDLTATFLECARVTRPADMDSRSLMSLLRGRTRSHRDHVLSGLGRWRAVFDGRYKLIRGFDPQRRRGKGGGGRKAPLLLFDLENDPLENTNIADREPKVVDRLSKILG